MKTFLTTTVMAIGILFGADGALGQEYSALWGRAGERWSATGRLPDFSFAGYRCGEEPLPTVPQVANVKAFGAKGDGRTDDSQAFLDAIAAGKRGAIYVPPGRYRITKILEIKRSGVVLRGAGADKTVLFFPTPLNDIRPNWGATTSGRRTSNYSWSGGFVWFKGSFRSKPIAAVTGEAKRGGKSVTVSSTAGVKVGQWIEISVRDDESRSLVAYLYSGDPGNTSKIRPASHRTSMACRVTAVTPGRIAFDRPLRFDIRLAWRPEVRRFDPDVTESGVEDICFAFPKRKYKGHFTELGYNAVAFSGVAHCWARRLRIVNADSGIMAGGTFCTIRGVTFALDGGQPGGGNVFGHHGVSLRNDNLFTEFDFKVRFIHDITVSRSAGNVCSNGRGVDLCFDHHKRAPHENLFTNIDLGAGTRMWRCGGGRDLGRHCGARETFWNIRAARGQRHPGGFGPASMNLVAVQTDQPAEMNPNGKWFEPIAPGAIRPQNLHEAQRARRLGK